MQYQVPVQIEMLWDAVDNEICLPIAQQIYKVLNRDPFDPAKPGIGIPVYFLTNPLSWGSLDTLPKDARRTLRVILLTPSLVLRSEWSQIQHKVTSPAQDHRDEMVAFEVGLSEGLVASGDLGLDVSGADDMAGPVLDQVIVQTCRLLAGRARPEMQARGAAPFKLFISHTKRDDDGEKIAERFAAAVRTLSAETFFDRVSIQKGDGISKELEANIHDAALVAVRTDRYVQSPWCRQELALAKRNGRPIVVVDALRGTEARSSPLLVNLPSIRLDANVGKQEGEAPEGISNAVTFVALQTLRFLYTVEKIAGLKEMGVVPESAVLLPRAPDHDDLFAASGGMLPDHASGTMFVYPDPVVGAEEAEYIQKHCAALITPSGAWGSFLSDTPIGISVGTVGEKALYPIGISDLHINDATRTLAQHLLAAGAHLVYGGALELSGPTAKGENLVGALFEMIAAYNRVGKENFPPLRNFSAWPFWTGTDLSWLAARRASLTVDCLPAPASAESRKEQRLSDLLKTGEGRCLVGLSLSAMRRKMNEATAARVLLGGAPLDFLGLMPGLVEEAMLAIEKGVPVYILGGFGGAGSAIANAILGGSPDVLTLDHQLKHTTLYRETLEALAQIDAGGTGDTGEAGKPTVNYPAMTRTLAEFGLEGLSETNGLSEEKNRRLLETRSLDEGIALIMEGLRERFMAT
ncbi:TIR domain-containing protein [Hwanghaeella sp.]|uniref:TIR domain-containing protein n=1 Tax=Hwanghaeella sp. TaxID=2605943 RepID=UPI003CCBCE1D